MNPTLQKPTSVRSFVLGFGLAAFWLPLVTSAQTPVVKVNDPFSDGGFTNGTDTLDTAWNFSSGALAVINDNGTDKLNGENALQANATADPGSLIANFAPQTLESGDALTVSVRFRIYANQTANSKGLRIGLGSSNGTYGFDLGTGGTAGAEFRQYSGLGASASSATVLPTKGSAIAFNDTKPRTLSLTITRSSTTTVSLTARLKYGNETYTWTGTASGTVLITFTGVALSQASTQNDILYDDIVITYAPRKSTFQRVAQWQFNEPPITNEPQVFAWDGSIQYSDLALRQNSTAVDLHTGASGMPPGPGPSAQSSDRALAIATSASHGWLQAPQASGIYQNFPGLTFCGWVKPSAAPPSGCHLVDWTGQERVQLWFSSDGKLNLSVGGTPLATTNDSMITESDVGQWVFLAATYTGGSTSGGVKFYRGTQSAELANVPTAPTPTGNTSTTGNIMNNSTTPGNLYLGNSHTLDQHFPGLIDDFRIYDGALGVLGAKIVTVGYNLEQIRQQGIAPKNLLLNGDFDTPPIGYYDLNNYQKIATQWELAYVSGASPGHAHETNLANVRTGTGAQKVVTDAQTDLNPSSFPLVQGVQLRGGQTYKGSIWLKAQDANMRVRVLLRQIAFPYTVYAVHTFTIPDTANFHEVVFYGGSPKDVDAIFALQLLSVGTIWADDAALEEVPTNETTMLPNKVVPGSFFGIHLNWAEVKVWPKMGQKTLRLWDTSTRWGDLEQSPGVWQEYNGSTPTYGLAHVNKLVNKAYNETSNPSILFTLGIPPAWAVSSSAKDFTFDGQILSTLPPDNLSAWTNYIQRVATSSSDWQNQGSPQNAARPIRFWEIWNEVDADFYAGDMKQLVVLTKYAAQTLKNISDKNQVLSPNFTGSGLIKLEEFLENPQAAWNAAPPSWQVPYPGKGGDSVDIWSIHSYADSFPEEQRPFLIGVKHMLSRFNQAHKELWNTEGGCFMEGTAPSLAGAGILARDYLMQWAEGISNFNWYGWDTSRYETNAVLLGTDPENADTLTAVGIGYREVAKWMIGAKVISKTVTRSQIGGQRWVLEITRPGSYKGWIVWDTAGSYTWNRPTSWSPVPSRLRTLNGNTTPYSGSTINVSQIPVLLETGYGPILSYNFDESGPMADAGPHASVTTSLTLRDNTTATDLHVASAGPFVHSSDGVFRASTNVMNVGGRNGYLAGTTALNGLTKFTITGWLKTNDFAGNKLGGGATLLSIGSQIKLSSQVANSGRLDLTVNNTSAATTANNYIPEIGSWVFFAISYDSTAPSGNVKFYRGTTTTSIGSPITANYNAGALNTSGGAVYIGNSSGLNRAFGGDLDRITVHGIVLTPEEIESIRTY